MKKASFGERLAAVLLDFVIQISVGLLVSGMFGLLTTLFSESRDTLMNQIAAIIASSGFAIFGIVWWLGYDILFLVKKGATPGKMILKLKVIKVDKSKITYSTAFLREFIGRIISSFFFFPIGYLWMLWDKNGQTWHDKVANTFVIKV